MQIITLILSVLALLIAGSALILMLKERQRNHARAEESRNGNKAFRKILMEYVAKEISEATSGVTAGMKDSIDNVNSRIDKTNKALRMVNGRAKDNSGRIEKLEHGCVPDFEEALRAVSAMNDMNSGIANIFGFDPLDALKKSRQEGD